MLDVFFKDKAQYTNKINPIKGYVEQLTMYISVKKQLPQEKAREIAVKILKDRFQDKTIKYFEREENGDRVVKDGTLLSYIKQNVADNNVLVPTFTSYTSGTKQKSILSEFIFVNVKKRSAAKKESQKAKAEKNMELFTAKDNEQSMMKIYNNSLSGVFGQQACVLHNPTAHNTLTSITRTMTSLSNASNEKLIAGNRYLPRAKDVLKTIVYTSTYVDVDKTKAVCEKYQLHLPSVQETVEMLQYSSDLYFHDEAYYQKYIIPYLQGLTPYHLAGICYSGDLYHIRKLNADFMRKLFAELTQKVHAPALDDISVMHTLDENILNYVHTVFFSEVKGLGKDYKKMNDAGVAGSLYATAKKVEQTLLGYKDFFNLFFMSEILPTNSFRLRNMRRRTVVLSDTDSTCFTLDEWVKWHRGRFVIDDESIALAGSISYIASQAIVHQLANFSRNMGVEEGLLNTLAMKNEYLWTVHVPCEVSKHYFAWTAMQEGNVFHAPDLEVKGQLLKNSAMPINIIKDGKALMEEVVTTVAGNGKIRLTDIVNRIKGIEDDIQTSVAKGEAVYLRKSKVKAKEAYAQDETKSPYQRHSFWQEVFAPKYGSIIDPPYDVVKIPTTITSKTSLNAWLESIEDKALSARLADWLTRYSKKDLPTLYLYEGYLISNGIPEEIFPVIDLKRIIMDTTLQHRTILATLGVMLNDDLTIREQFT